MAGSLFSAVAEPLIGSAVSSLFGGGGGGGGGGGAAAAAADPFASQRPQYQQQLSDLMSGKTQYEQTAGAKFAMQQGLDAVSAHNRAAGHANSGNEDMELTRYAAGVAGQGYQQQMANLMTLSGATGGASGTAGNILSSQAAADATARATYGSTVGSAVMGSDTVKGWLNGGGALDMAGFQTGSGVVNPWAGAAAGGGGGLGSGTFNPGGSDLLSTFTF